MIDYLPIALEADPPRWSGSRAPALLACSKTLPRAHSGAPKHQPLSGLCFSYQPGSGQFADGAAIKTLQFLISF